MKKKIISILLALVLACSFSLVTAPMAGTVQASGSEPPMGINKIDDFGTTELTGGFNYAPAGEKIRYLTVGEVDDHMVAWYEDREETKTIRRVDLTAGETVGTTVTFDTHPGTFSSNWHPRVFPVPAGPDFDGGGLGMYAGGVQHTGTGNSSHFYTSTDGGRTWTHRGETTYWAGSCGSGVAGVVRRSSDNRLLVYWEHGGTGFHTSKTTDGALGTLDVLDDYLDLERAGEFLFDMFGASMAVAELSDGSFVMMGTTTKTDRLHISLLYSANGLTDWTLVETPKFIDTSGAEMDWYQTSPDKFRLFRDDGVTGHGIQEFEVVFGSPSEVGVDDNWSSQADVPDLMWGYNAFATIQDGINAVAEAGTINVAAGEYDETVELKDTTATGISIIGQDKTTTFITGGIGFAADYSGLKVQHFTISGNGFLGTETYEATVSNIWPGHRVITDLEFSDCIFDGENYDDGKGGRMGIVIKRLGGVVKFVNNEFKNYPGSATLDVNDGSGEGALTVTSYTLINNKFLDNGGGCALRGNPEDYTDTVIVTGNTFDGPAAWAALEVNRAENVEIYDNVIRNVKEYLDWDEGQAIQLWQIGTADIYANTIENNYQGIAILTYPEPYDISNISVHHNSFSGNAEYALSVDDGLIGGPLNAENNYWGHATGADHADNPHDTGRGGDVVIGNVDFTPWYATATTTSGTENVSVDHPTPAGTIIAYSDTIQDGIDAAVSDDTVNVTAGIYREHITINESSLNLIGEDRETTIIDARQDSSWTVAKPGILIGEYPLVDGVHGVKVSGFTIRDAAMQEEGVPYEGAKYGVGPGGLAGIQIYNSSNNTIEDNILINNYWQIWLVAEWPGAGYTECMNNRIAYNVIMDSENDGVYLYSDGGVFVQDTEIIENEISNAYGEYASGIEFWGCPEGGDTPTISGTVISSNNITSCTYGVRIRGDVGDITGTSVNYNNFIDNTNYGIYNGVTSTINAKYNWWGRIGGPGGEGLGNGDSVSANVDYDPWLTEMQADTVREGIAYFGSTISLEPGWNTLSVPLKLKDSANTMAEIVGLGDFLISSVTAKNWEIAYQYNPAIPGWENIGKSAIDLVPGRGYYIKILGTDTVDFPVLYSGTLGLPALELSAGWNLIGSAFGIDKNDYGIVATDGDADGKKLVKDALYSIKDKCSVVVSPSTQGQEAAWGTTVIDSGKNMIVGEAYWVFMTDSATLAGFEVTPIYYLP